MNLNLNNKMLNQSEEESSHSSSQGELSKNESEPSHTSSIQDESEISNLTEILEETRNAKIERRERLIQLIEWELLNQDHPELSPVQDDVLRVQKLNNKQGNILTQTSTKIRKDLNKIKQQLRLQPQNRSEQYLLDVRRELYSGDNKEIVREALGIDLDEDLTLDNGAMEKLTNLMKTKFILLRMAPNKKERIKNLKQLKQNYMVKIFHKNSYFFNLNSQYLLPSS